MLRGKDVELVGRIAKVVLSKDVLWMGMCLNKSELYSLAEKSKTIDVLVDASGKALWLYVYPGWGYVRRASKPKADEGLPMAA